MKRVFVFGTLVLVMACAPARRLFRAPAPEAGSDSLYWRAVARLDTANRQNKPGSLDSAMTQLDAYLAYPRNLTHRREAIVLRQLARDSRQLAKVETALQHARSDTSTITLPARPHSDGDAKRREDESLKEIQRLKEELAKANEELERIRKRLATPKPD